MPMTAHMRVPAAEAELAADALWAAGAEAVEERPQPDGTVVLVSDRAPEGPWPVQWVDVADDGLDAWRAYAVAERVGPTSALILQPAWLPVPEWRRASDVVVCIDPGRAFGTGTHPTTRGCLGAVEAFAGPGKRVLDLGSGSGVLAVAAALLGARVVAVDLDPAARVATAANAAANGVEGAVEVLDGLEALDAGASAAPFDLVLANIPASALVALAGTVLALTESSAPVIVAGFLTPAAEDVQAAFAPRRSDPRFTGAPEWPVLCLLPEAR